MNVSFLEQRIVSAILVSPVAGMRPRHGVDPA